MTQPTDRSTPPPWYRQAWPWLLMLMPALAIVGGAITFWLAATTNNSLVVDDYYKEGKAINRQLEREQSAERLGLAATIARGPDGGAELRLASAAGAPLPPFVTVRLVHATRAELDRTVTLSATGGGVYRSGQAELPDSGRWNVLVEDPDRSWRLAGSATGFTEPLRLGGPPQK